MLMTSRLYGSKKGRPKSYCKCGLGIMTVKIIFGKTGFPRFNSDVVFYKLFQITISHYSIRESLWTGEKEIVK